MSIQWSIIAGCLYTEMTVVIILMLPIASPKRWSRLFRSRLFSYFQSHVFVYFYVVLSIMSLLLFDAVREMRKYHSPADASHAHLASELKTSVKLFRAQRNFYITGFSIFLTFVIRRIITMILIQSDLLDNSALLIKKAEETVTLAKESILSHATSEKSNESTDDLQAALDELAVQVQARHAQEQMIKDMTVEIEIWKHKYEEAVGKHKEAGDHTA